MKGSILRASLDVRYSSTLNPCTAPPKRVAKALASKRVIGPMPPRPARMLSHAPATVLPSGVTIPSPVTTTRRRVTGAPFEEGPLEKAALDGRSLAEAEAASQAL